MSETFAEKTVGQYLQVTLQPCHCGFRHSMHGSILRFFNINIVELIRNTYQKGKTFLVQCCQVTSRHRPSGRVLGFVCVVPSCICVCALVIRVWFGVRIAST